MAAFPVSADGISATTTFSFDVRTVEGRTAPVTCATCGCRLSEARTADGSAVWYHFSGVEGRDARGCSIACSTYPHLASGDALGPI